MTIYCDIDGTLTKRKRGDSAFVPCNDMIGIIRKLIADGNDIIMWSGRGAGVASDFAKQHGLKPKYCLTKPDAFFDDRPGLKPGPIPIIDPKNVRKWLKGKGVSI